MHTVYASSEDEHEVHTSKAEQNKHELLGAAQSRQHDEHADEDEAHEEGAVLTISTKSQELAQIKTEKLAVRKLPISLYSPGEVTFNQEKSALIEPRVSAQVLKQFVFTGEHIQQGQPLVRLSSVEVAKAQSDLLLAAQEWHRFRALKSTNTITEQQFESSKIRYEHAYGLLQSYGISPKEIDELVSAKEGQQAMGAFNLVAPMDGTVMASHVTLGEHIEAGTTLYEVFDEHSLWVNAQVTPAEHRQIQAGQIAIVNLDQFQVQGKVTQIHHAVNETTRRLTVRVEIDNPEDKLHPGDFVDVGIQVATTDAQLAVPESALVRSPDGDWMIYVESKNEQFESKEVERLKAIDQWVVIAGVSPGVRYVKDGAFFVHAEAQKGSFDAHNH